MCTFHGQVNPTFFSKGKVTMAIPTEALSLIKTAAAAAKPALEAAKQLPKPETAVARLQLGLKSAQSAVAKLTEGQLRYILGGKEPLAGITSHAEAKNAVKTKLLYAEQNLGGPGAAAEFHSTLRDNSGFLQRFLQVGVARTAGVRDASKIDFTKQDAAIKQLAKDPQFGTLVEALSTKFKLGVPVEKLPAPAAPKTAYQPRAASFTPREPTGLSNPKNFEPTAEEINNARKGVFPARMGAEMSELYDSVPSILARQKFEAAVAQKGKEWGLPPAMPNPHATSAQVTETIENAERERRWRGI